MAYATGKFAKGLCDRCGFEYKLLQLKEEWNGAKVCHDCYEPKHPQLEPKRFVAEPQGLRNARPDRTENEVIAILGPNPFETIAASSGIINVTEKSHGRSTSDTVRFRGALSTSKTFKDPQNFDGITGSNVAKSAGYSITVGKRDSSGNITNTDDFYHFTVDTNTATSGGVSGGGENCSAGPATLTA